MQGFEHQMPLVVGLIGLLLVVGVLRDAFETIILPRRVSGVRFSKVFYVVSWKPWAAVARRMGSGDRRETLLSVYGPLSLLVLLILWGILLITGFALLLWAANFDVSLSAFGHLYVSGTSFTTLGIGDFTPHTDLARFVTVVEAGTGFGFLAVVISYLPILYQSFSRREIAISMLDEWAGSPPSAGDLIRRVAQAGAMDDLRPLLASWEEWTAELLESHLSYQVLSYFRSQHENQSWLAALTAMMDVAAVWQAAKAEGKTWTARRMYAIGRHALGDLSQILRASPRFDAADRLSEAEARSIYQDMAEAGAKVDFDVFWDRLKKLRKGYEPYASALSEELLMDLPPWSPVDGRKDNWETTAWEGSAPGESLR
ncbi:MAG: two pore domain potassium channel family protein [Chloroflexi bacterium]|nr:MAG: two pore domain potassium channel family protein [Chloroflexota bacterium]TME39276.1 MAG: two pore domain potassium channel family protein [Chloroflexota bacterium]TME49511.1 MAG: two pore domain potassium channel family protein [Chloroflexota bacterium]